LGHRKSTSVQVGVLLTVLLFCTKLGWTKGTITLNLSSSAESFVLTAASSTNAGNTTITATTNWSLAPPNTLNVYAYFANSTAALTDSAGHNIPSSAFNISDNGGAFRALTNTIPFSGTNAGLQLESIDITPFNKNGTINDVMSFSINLTALTQLPAATYTGILFVQAQAAGPGGETSVPQAITLTATLGESLSVSLSANSVMFNLNAGNANNAGSSPITATTAWVLKTSRTTVALYAYFTDAGAALSDGAGDNIPSSAFSVSDNGGAFAPLTNTVGFGGANAGIQLANTAITSANENSSRTDAMSFNIDLTSGTLPQLPPATYTGTLRIQAQATP
jgi:hypothetical protein